MLGAPYHLLLIGGEQSGRAGNVTRLPYCRDNRALASYFAAADGFVHAGTHETFGLVILEALACARPVVAMRAGAVPELLDERAGMLAEPHEDPARAAANLAAAIAALYDRDLTAPRRRGTRPRGGQLQLDARAAGAHVPLPGGDQHATAAGRGRVAHARRTHALNRDQFQPDHFCR